MLLFFGGVFLLSFFTVTHKYYHGYLCVKAGRKERRNLFVYAQSATSAMSVINKYHGEC